MKRPLQLAALLAAAALVLTGCANDPLAEQYRNGTEQNYISGDGTVTEIAIDQREPAVDFEAETDTGEKVSSDDYRGEVLVLNFWYAGCPPCRAEAPDLQELNEQFSAEGASFLGVNTRDQAANSLSFAEKFGITYPSVLDADDGNMLFAFTGVVAANAVPTTLVIDREGRVAARILGRLDGPSTLKTLIRDALAEEG